MKSTSHKISPTGFMALFLVLFLTACAATPDGGQSTRKNARRPASASRSGDIAVGSDGLAGIDLGEDWDQPRRPAGQTFPDSTFSSRSTDPLGSRNPGLLTTRTGRSGPAEWAIVLFTYTDSNHVEIANYAADQLKALLGEPFQGVRARTRKNGSMVLYGSYSGRDDPKAREDVRRLRAMTRNGKRVFPRVILSYLEEDVDLLTLSPHDLRRVRLKFPKLRGLTTLDVGVWSTFGDENLDYERLKRDAEQYTEQLRSQGHEAYFYHDEKTKTSSVTVGLFGPGALDAQSGMYSTEVLKYLRLFPDRYNNGQILKVPIDRFHPDRGVRNQAPVLVEVPQLK